MIFDKTILKKSLSSFETQKDRLVLSHGFFKIITLEVSNQFSYQVRFVMSDIWNLVTIILRLEFQRKLYLEKKIHPFIFFQFVKCDVNLFHVVLRSIFDYTANIIQIISPGQFRKDDSFRTIIQRIDTLEKNGVIEPALASIIRKQSWFHTIREVRDSGVHSGGIPMVVLDEDTERLFFQMYTRGYHQKVDIPEIRYSENAVFLDSYIGMCFGYLLDYLDGLGEFISKKYELREVHGFLDCHGLDVVYQWIETCVRA